MSVSISQEKRILIKSSTPVTSHDSSVYSNDAGRIRDERQIEKIQPQSVQHKETIRSADPIINEDRTYNHLLRAFCSDMSNKVDLGNDALDTEWFQPPNTVRPQVGFGTASGNYTKTNTARLNIEMQLLQQNQTILELQKQMQGLLEINLQQQQQRLVNEEAVRRMQKEITHESAVKEDESMQTQPVVDEIGIVSLDNSPPLPASNDCLDGPESLPTPTLQRIWKRAEGSEVAINEKKQLSSNVRVLHPCTECGKERDERQIEKKQPQNVQHEETIRFADPIIIDDRTDKHFLPPNAVVQQPQVGIGTASVNYTKTKTAGLNTELEFLKQNQTILESLKQMQGLLEFHVQQQQQRLLNEGISPSLPASNECLDRPESLPPPTLQSIPKRTEGSKVTINEKKQLFSNVRVQMCNDAQKHSIVNIRKNSTLYPCKKCVKEFTRKCDLNRHFRTHTDEKPFLCDICQRSFKWKDNLRSHMSTHHGLKTWKCNVCQKSFCQKSSLSRHRKRHTKDKE